MRAWLWLGMVGCVASEPGVERPELSSLRVTLDGGRVVDALGREVWLRGVNTGSRSKNPPFFPFAFAESGLPDQVSAPPFDEAAAAFVARVAGRGLNVVRLPFVWEAVEPERGRYDAVFLDRYAALAGAFGDVGVRVIVDAHQDVFSRRFCGSGAPAWADPPDAPPRPEDCTSWFQGYLGDPDVNAAFDRFWADEDGLRTAFVTMWGEVASRVADTDAVVAWEILNEPHRGSLDEATWATEVMPSFWTDVAAAQRAAAELPVLLDTTGQDGVSGETMLVPPDGDFWIWAPHYYHPAVYVLGPELAPGWDVVAGLAPWAEFGREHDLPVLLGEFGSKTGSEAAGRYLADNFAALDVHAMHGTAWELSTTADDWNDEGYSVISAGTETPSFAALARVYPDAVAGAVGSFSFDGSEAALSWTAVNGVTELALGPWEVVSVTLEGAATAWSEADGRLLVQSGVGEASVRVTVR